MLNPLAPSKTPEIRIWEVLQRTTINPLRSKLTSADSMLVFAVWRRSAVDNAQSASVSHGQKGNPVALWSSRTQYRTQKFILARNCN